MTQRVRAGSFYDDLPREADFTRLSQSACYAPVPEGWYIGVADIVNSTGEVAAGRYKTVNMVGAAVISAVINAHEGQAFPFVFGGDGAGFVIDPEQLAHTRAALAAVRTWAEAEFAIGMRVALVPVSAARAAGHDVRVARFQASQGADYAMFFGGGLLWAEDQMKSGAFSIPEAPIGTTPDLTGLSCRWAHMPARHGTILSLVVAAHPTAAPEAVALVYGEIIAIAAALDRGGHPAPAAGMQAHWPSAGTTLEAHAARGAGSFHLARLKALMESLVAWGLLRTGVKLGSFDARRYARIVSANADFRKLDDGLKMTLDCDPKTHARLEAVLKAASARGVIRYGIATQGEAMMTCIVPSIMTDDHFHFIDGAAGGYTQAASQMKGR